MWNSDVVQHRHPGVGERLVVRDQTLLQLGAWENDFHRDPSLFMVTGVLKPAEGARPKPAERFEPQPASHEPIVVRPRILLAPTTLDVFKPGVGAVDPKRCPLIASLQ